MHIISYKNRNFLSLFLILSSFIAILLMMMKKDQLVAFLVAGTTGLIVADYITQRYSLRSAALCGSFFAAIGHLAIVSESVAAQSFGYVFFGISAGIMLLFVPGVSLVSWYSHLKAGQVTTLWVASFLCGGLLSLLNNSLPVLFSSLCLIALFLGAFVLKSYPAVPKDPYASMQLFSPFSRGGKYFSFKLFVFFASVALGMLFICSEPFLNNDWFFIMVVVGAVFCPFSFMFFIEKKGLFSASIFFIFTLEICAACFVFAEESYLIQAAGLFLLGGSSIISLCLFVFLYHYLFGAANVSRRLSRAFIMVPLGMAIAFLIPTAENDRIVLIFFTILCSFFSLFSAWSHRLTLLKSR